MKIAVENSTWNNIGDAFYQLSLQNIFSELFPSVELCSFDGPGKRAFRPGKHSVNMADFRPNVDADHFVLSGPILGSNFLEHYGSFIKSIVKGGKSYSLLSIHFWSNFDPGPVLEFLKQYPPLAFHTRDAPSFDIAGNVADVSFSGICFAFFVSRIPNIPQLTFDHPQLAVSFHSGPEPKISFSNPNADHITDVGLSVGKSSRLLWRFKRHLEYRTSLPISIGKYGILRPVHGFYPLPHLIFSKPNSYITYNPLNMLGVYKSVEAVVTDRVHAGIAALSFGNPASVEQVDGRFAIFDTLPLERRGGVFLPNPDAVNSEYDRLAQWLTGSYAKAIGLS